ncbi:hypothetical protein SAMN02745857_01293 [Andreprevotia lacus DSM 23236]|jgi:hypothetical protein|uniref:Lipoprotein n=1 Tax=Andreprevotia lacus DSM 23236 TaxID=1121001 RepID=A0A1W1XDJ5_9NEIS|nr:hypothetical protein [Andreprevotia lacus]SMC21957.1 hypothetical protein SAMN02745857_01293 [Andreprevotia lacus DSM 23236]
MPGFTRYLLAAACVISLSACDQVVDSAKQQAASMVAEQARNAANDLKQQASAVLADAGLDASKVAEQLSTQREALKQSAARLAGSDWQVLDQYVGQYPQDLGLYTELSPITPELKSLLGDKIKVLRANMAVQGPLSRDGVLYATGNKAHQGGAEAAYVLIDTRQRQLEVGLIERGQLTVYRTQGSTLVQPKDVQTMLGNLQHK